MTAGNALSKGAIILCVAGTACSAALGQTPPTGGYRVQVVSPTDAMHSFAGSTTVLRSWFGANGVVAGQSLRRAVDGTDLGSDAWVFADGQTTIISRTGGFFDWDSSSGVLPVFRSSGVVCTTTDGGAIGSSRRYGQFVTLGTEYWRYQQGQWIPIGLTGPGYDDSDGLALSTLQFAFSTGTAGGTTGRRPGGEPGTDVYVFDGATTRLAGLTGPGYENSSSGTYVRRVSTLTTMNSSGRAGGTTTRQAGDAAVTALGSDAWYFDGTTTHAAGLTGAIYQNTVPAGTQRNSAAVRITESGHLLGKSERLGVPPPNSGGYDYWVSDGGATRQVGPSGGDYVVRSNGVVDASAQAINEQGHIAGYTTLWPAGNAPACVDGWLDTNGGLRLFHSMGSDQQYQSATHTVWSTRAMMLNEADQVAGYAARFLPSGEGRGTDAWFFDGQTSRIVSLSGAGVEWGSAPVPTREATLTRLSPDGHVCGTNRRFSSTGGTRGRDAWAYFNGQTRRINPIGAGYESNHADVHFRDTTIVETNGRGDICGYSLTYTANGAQSGSVGWVYVASTGVTHVLGQSINPATGTPRSSVSGISENGVVYGSYSRYEGAVVAETVAFLWSPETGLYIATDLDLGETPALGLTSGGAAGMVASAPPAPGGFPGLMWGFGTTPNGSHPALLFTSIPAHCGRSDVGGPGGFPGADGSLDNNDFIAFIDLFFSGSPLADMGSSGAVAVSDGLFDNNDFIVFINQFFEGCEG